MKTITMKIELAYDDTIMHGDNSIAIEWFFKDVLRRDRLTLYSNEIGDEIGDVKVLDILSEGD